MERYSCTQRHLLKGSREGVAVHFPDGLARGAGGVVEGDKLFEESVT